MIEHLYVHTAVMTLCKYTRTHDYNMFVIILTTTNGIRIVIFRMHEAVTMYMMVRSGH